eukprot:1147146-Pelagomonas_calceolata.AAC.13
MAGQPSRFDLPMQTANEDVQTSGMQVDLLPQPAHLHDLAVLILKLMQAVQHNELDIVVAL